MILSVTHERFGKEVEFSEATPQPFSSTLILCVPLFDYHTQHNTAKILLIPHQNIG